MAEEKVTCRYCGSEDVSNVPVPGGTIPLCDRHGSDLAARLVRDLDRIMGEPVHNPKVAARPGEGDKPADQGDKPEQSF